MHIRYRIQHLEVLWDLMQNWGHEIFSTLIFLLGLASYFSSFPFKCSFHFGFALALLPWACGPRSKPLKTWIKVVREDILDLKWLMVFGKTSWIKRHNLCSWSQQHWKWVIMWACWSLQIHPTSFILNLKVVGSNLHIHDASFNLKNIRTLFLTLVCNDSCSWCTKGTSDFTNAYGNQCAHQENLLWLHGNCCLI